MRFGSSCLGRIGSILALTLASLGVALAAEPVALILDIPTDNKVQAFDEAVAGQVIQLTGGQRVTFSHYRRCEEVTVASGTVVLYEDSYRTSGGRVTGVVKINCAQIGVAATEGVLGGVVMRSGGKSIACTTPVMLLAGAAIVGSASIQIPDGRNLVVPHDGRRVDLSAGDPLKPGNYVLHLVMEDGTRSAEFQVRNVDCKKTRTIIRVK